MSRSRALLALAALAALLSTSALAGDDDDSADASDEASAPAEPAFDPGPGSVLVVRLDAMTINRGSKEYMLSGLERVQTEPELRALVIEIDTPGGALEETRLLVKEMLGSEVPIITYVSPPGSRAASAGVFITMAGHVAAMAPATHTGAAHPVFMKPGGGGGDEDDEGKQKARDSEAAMLEKVTEDTVSFIRNIADVRGRNADWGERAVRESVTVEEVEAVELGVVDLVAETLDDLLEEIDGREVELLGGRRVILRTRGPVVEHTMSTRIRVLYLLTEPTVAYLLLMAGLLGLGIELRSPGLVAPGVIGAVCLLLGLFSLSALPVNLVALIFVFVGAGLIIADFFVASYGLLSVGGVASLAFGGLFLIEKTPEVPVGVSPAVVGIVAVASLLVAFGVGFVILKDRDRKVYTGVAGLIGARGKVTRAIVGGDNDSGQVFVQGERWSAMSDIPLADGTRVVVREVDGMVLTVAPLDGAEG